MAGDCGRLFAALVLGQYTWAWVGSSRAEVHAILRNFGMCAEPVCHGGRFASCFRYFGRLVFGLPPTFNGANHFALLVSSSGARSSTPSRPRPTGNGRGQGRTPSQSPAWQTGSRNNPVDECLQIYPRLHRPLDTSSNCWPLDEHFPGVLAVCSSIETDDPSL